MSNFFCVTCDLCRSRGGRGAHRVHARSRPGITVPPSLRGRGASVADEPPTSPIGSNFGFQTHDRHSFGTGLSAGGLARMQTQTQYRDFAEECDRLAKQAKTERESMVLNEMAEVWRSLAEEADRRYFKKSG